MHRDLVEPRLPWRLVVDVSLRAVKGGGSYCSSSDRRILFGLGRKQYRPRRIAGELRWPGGQVQTWKRLPRIAIGDYGKGKVMPFGRKSESLTARARRGTARSGHDTPANRSRLFRIRQPYVRVVVATIQPPSNAMILRMPLIRRDWLAALRSPG